MNDPKKHKINQKCYSKNSIPARINPDCEIYFLLATNEKQVIMERSPLIDALLKYPNVHIKYVNLEEFSIGTPLQEFMALNMLGKSKYPIEHTSDILRILTLYKYGGAYLDLDVISMYPLRLIDRKNFVCLQAANDFANGMIRLDLNEGKKYSGAYIE